MTMRTTHTIEYFRAGANHFWHWADNGEVIEWTNETTICYREDVLVLLKNFYCVDTPSLSAILLLLAACNSNFESSGGKGILAAVVRNAKGHDKEPLTSTEYDEIHQLLDDALTFMDIIASLPADLRSGPARLVLLHQVFAGKDFNTSHAPLKSLIEEFDTGRTDRFIFRSLFTIPANELKSDLSGLSAALERFPNKNSLQMRLQTGINNIPNVVDIKVSMPDETDLFATLLRDPRTAAIAKITKQLNAVFNIPLHVNGKSDLPLGGVSDISNRGGFDRLLLSELAYEDNLLIARLANNEALYYQREQPPDHPKLIRTLLLDTTVRMWGIPRILSISAAISITHNVKHHETVRSYSLGNNTSSSVDFESKAGIITALSTLDASLHCGESLKNVVDNQLGNADEEIFFITERSVLETPEFYSVFYALRTKIDYLIIVTHEGIIEYYSLKKGARKLLTTAKIDVQQMMLGHDIILQPLHELSLPVFYSQHPHPLYHPLLRLTAIESRKEYTASGVLMVNEINRVLLILQNNKSAIELLEYIESGDYTFSQDTANQAVFHIAVHSRQKKLLKFYSVKTDRNIIMQVDCSDRFQDNCHILFLENSFRVRSASQEFQIECPSGKIANIKEIKYPGNVTANSAITSISVKNTSPNPPGYNVLLSTNDVYVNIDGCLVLGKNQLLLRSNDHLVFDQFSQKNMQKIKIAKNISGVFYPLANKKIKCSRWQWADGSEAFLDGKGFLHLKSSDLTIAEITLTTVIEMKIAAWYAGGVVSGSEYFVGKSQINIIDIKTFYQKYIQAFIDRLL